MASPSEMMCDEHVDEERPNVGGTGRGVIRSHSLPLLLSFRAGSSSDNAKTANKSNNEMDDSTSSFATAKMTDASHASNGGGKESSVRRRRSLLHTRFLGMGSSSSTTHYQDSSVVDTAEDLEAPGSHHRRGSFIMNDQSLHSVLENGIPENDTLGQEVDSHSLPTFNNAATASSSSLNFRDHLGASARSIGRSIRSFVSVVAEIPENDDIPENNHRNRNDDTPPPENDVFLQEVDESSSVVPTFRVAFSKFRGGGELLGASTKSMKSLVSVVAEMVTHPVHFATVALADLETERYRDDHPVRNYRAEFLSASVSLQDDDVGIRFSKGEDNNTLQISFLAENGPFAKSHFAVGDKLVSINGLACRTSHEEDVSEALRTVRGRLNIVVHNVGGDPELVHAMITKDSPTSKTGLGVKSNGPGTVQISSIAPDGFCVESMLSVGDVLLSINNESCALLTSTTAADMITASPDVVTLLARSNHEMACVIAEGSESGYSMRRATAVVPHPSTSTTIALSGEDFPPYQQRSSRKNSCSCDLSQMTPRKAGTRLCTIYACLLTVVGLKCCILLDLYATTFLLVLIAGYIYGRFLQLPWRCRSPGRRCSNVQLGCDAVLMTAFAGLFWQSDLMSSEELMGIMFGILVPSAILLNMPSIVLELEEEQEE